MAGYTQKTKDVQVDVLILPGFNEGLARRGAWLAWVQPFNDFIRKFLSPTGYVVRYNIYEPLSEVPLSDGEIEHLVNEIATAQDQYFFSLDLSELQMRWARKTGWLNALIYFLGIWSVRWWWWFFLCRWEIGFFNKQNAIKKRYADNIRKALRFWERGTNEEIKRVLSEVKEIYYGERESAQGVFFSPQMEPLRKYSLLREHCRRQKMLAQEEGNILRAEAYAKVEKAYRDIINRFTGRSLAVQILPTSFWQRILQWFTRTLKIPEPENIFPVRNLNKKISLNFKVKVKPTRILGKNRMEGNLLELYLLWSKRDEPVCVPVRDAYYLQKSFARADNIVQKDLPLEIVLQVGTEWEKEALLGFNSVEPEKIKSKQQDLVLRLQGAALDTLRQEEAIISYYLREIIAIYQQQISRMYPLRSRVRQFFPWLFITNGIPVASILAATWLFIDPYFGKRLMGDWEEHFSRILRGVNLGYHNVIIRIKTNSALGFINQRIREDEEGKAYREIIREINQCALPVSLMDRALFNNITTETLQLQESQREANDFTTIPLSFYDEYEDRIKGLSEVVK